MVGDEVAAAMKMLSLGSSATGTNHLQSRKLQCGSKFGIIWSNLLGFGWGFFEFFVFCCQFLFCLSLTSFNLFSLIVVCFVALSASAFASPSLFSGCFKYSAGLSLPPMLLLLQIKTFSLYFSFGVGWA